ncbi:MAG: hypothetical protein GY940_07650, partial [bacterium]|nr:hypothetical protein [bacterium]
QVEEKLVRIWTEVLKPGTETIGIHDNFFDVGGNSLSIIRVIKKINESFSRDVHFTVMFNHPTIEEMSGYLIQTGKEVAVEHKTAVQEHTAQEGVNGREIAVIGMAGRFPGASNIDQFWDNLVNGIESISFLSEEEAISAGVAPETVQDPAFIRAKGRLEVVDTFDSFFFGYNHA